MGNLTAATLVGVLAWTLVFAKSKKLIKQAIKPSVLPDLVLIVVLDVIMRDFL
jgi:hypothetical protein